MACMNQQNAMEAESKPQILTGILCALGAISIWSGSMAMTRLGVTTSLTASDITMLRFGVAGILLIPVLLKRGLALEKLGSLKFILLVLGAGVPYSLASSTGLLYAPAAHAGALIPGIMPLFVALFSLIFLKDRFSNQRKFGYIFIMTGLLTIVAASSAAIGNDSIIGHIMFLVAAFMWACYTIVLRQSGIDSLHATAIVSAGSLVIFAPIYCSIYGLNFLDAPAIDIIYQALFQGVFTAILALYLFGKAVSILGTSIGVSFGALVPGLAAIFAIPILGEYPSVFDWLGITIVTVGVYLASGGRIQFMK